MSRLIYENSVSYRGYLIIPFVCNKIGNTFIGNGSRGKIYSYKLLAENGSRNKLHKAENPTEIYGDSIDNIIDIGKKYIDRHLIDKNLELVNKDDAFKNRYTYRNNLIIVSEEAGKYHYDHYSPESLNNIAAPKIFKSEFDCISWIKEGIDGLHLKRKVS
ncbi:hypothetical protein [Brunnivagina elsteri]|uniref:Uncharacterized protein n=1 Tax=Brunnivagina elsteri CCALA 953 TaxID=987040 RepID=A0A2A2THX2_9CYAN|nr:hypothetical protein [Calothrix elsteri]PAX53340.1 hypothetical protein CK510_14510 [Calothrix elsteri CCALA 953]